MLLPHFTRGTVCTNYRATVRTQQLLPEFGNSRLYRLSSSLVCTLMGLHNQYRSIDTYEVPETIDDIILDPLDK